ncbi:hypothetical protein [Kocuria marina]|uniref:hypothetical protein n=1 Tax=Kocuria marina TaxID=223184 RepID=UPI0011A031EA|nr:hypothetical protein [Kocuria indica]
MSSSPSSRPAALLRSLCAALCAILAGAGFAAWLGLTWIQDHLLSPSGFQDTAAAVVTETTFQDELVRTVLDRATFTALSDVEVGIEPVDQAIERVRETAVTAAQSWLTAPEQQGTWIQVLQDTHDANVPLSADSADAPEHLVVDATALGAAVDHQVEDVIGISPGIARNDLAMTVPGAETGRVLDALVGLAPWRYALPWLVALLAVLAVVVSPRRWLAIAGVGLAGVLFTGVLLAVVLWAASSVVDASGVEPVAHLVTEQIITLLRESFVGRSVTGMIGAACVALVGVIGAVVRSRMVTYH